MSVGWLMASLKKNKFSSKSNLGENLQVLYIMNLVSLVTFEKFKWLLMAPAVIFNNCNFTKQYLLKYLNNILKQWIFRRWYLDTPSDTKPC